MVVDLQCERSINDTSLSAAWWKIRGMKSLLIKTLIQVIFFGGLQLTPLCWQVRKDQRSKTFQRPEVQSSESGSPKNVSNQQTESGGQRPKYLNTGEPNLFLSLRYSLFLPSPLRMTHQDTSFPVLHVLSFNLPLSDTTVTDLIDCFGELSVGITAFGGFWAGEMQLRA